MFIVTAGTAGRRRRRGHLPQARYDDMKLLLSALLGSLLRLPPRVVFAAFGVVLFVLATIDSMTWQVAPQVRAGAFDFMLRHRLMAPAADPQIALVDIDDRSYARISQVAGRWPWPRDVFATVVGELERRGARAVVFDIVPGAPDNSADTEDGANPRNTAAAQELLASRVAVWPMVRLPADSDRRSDLSTARLPALQRLAPRAGDRPVALMLPALGGVAASPRLGTRNFHPDADGVVRRFRYFEDVDGWRIPSLPWTVARMLDWRTVAGADEGLSWPAGPRAHQRISFAEVLEDALHPERRRSGADAANRIYVIGASAAALADGRASPVSFRHGSADILATALDNLKNARFLREVPDWLNAAFVLLSLAWSTGVFIRRRSHRHLRRIMLFGALVLLALSYLCLSLFDLKVDLAVPAGFVLLYSLLATSWLGLLQMRLRGEGPFARQFAADSPYRLQALTIFGRDGAARTKGTALEEAVLRFCPSACMERRLFRSGPLAEGTAAVAHVYWVGPQLDPRTRETSQAEAVRFSAWLKEHGISHSVSRSVVRTDERGHLPAEGLAEQFSAIGRALITAERQGGGTEPVWGETRWV